MMTSAWMTASPPPLVPPAALPDTSVSNIARYRQSAENMPPPSPVEATLLTSAHEFSLTLPSSMYTPPP